MRDYIPIKGHMDFKKFLNDIKIDRIKNGKDTKIISDKRLTLAISRVDKLKELIINAELKDERKKR